MDVHSLIEVRAPYWALDAFELASPGEARALVQPEQPSGHERSAMPAAEAGRHLAILGSCACASLRPSEGKHYYLAVRAELRASAPLPLSDGPLVLDARALTRERHEASAACSLRTQDGTLLYELAVTYRVLGERLFQRMFAPYRRDMRTRPRVEAEAASDARALRRNPYREPLPYRVIEHSSTQIIAALDEVRPEHCAGHFPLYPALPVAMLMHALSSLSGELLRERTGPCDYRVRSARVRAEHLAFAGQALRFESQWLEAEGDLHRFRARAQLPCAGLAGELELELERIG